jgi:hypothetical protein
MPLIFCLKECILIRTCFHTKSLGQLRIGFSCTLAFLTSLVLHGTQSHICRLMLSENLLRGGIRLISHDRRGSSLGPALRRPAGLACLFHRPLFGQIHNELGRQLSAWSIFRYGSTPLADGCLGPDVHHLLCGCSLCLTAGPARVLLGDAESAGGCAALERGLRG